ncbi:MAG: GNAT family N-acetyltransferase [Sphingobium sp.]
MSDAYRIRLAEVADIPALAALKLAAFRETFIEDFAIPYPPADLALFETESYGEAKVAAELADATHRTWVAQAEDGALVAYVHVGPSKLPHPDVGPEDVELYQLYLLRACQGAGLGRRLMGVALGWMEAHRPGPIWLGVWSGNDRARAVYARFGFRQVGTYDFAVGNHRDHEFILRR